MIYLIYQYKNKNDLIYDFDKVEQAMNNLFTRKRLFRLNSYSINYYKEKTINKCEV